MLTWPMMWLNKLMLFHFFFKNDICFLTWHNKSIYFRIWVENICAQHKRCNVKASMHSVGKNINWECNSSTTKAINHIASYSQFRLCHNLCILYEVCDRSWQWQQDVQDLPGKKKKFNYLFNFPNFNRGKSYRRLH